MMRAMNRLAAALALATATLAGARGLAFAQGPDAIFDSLTMDRHTPISTLDVDFAYVVYDEPQDVDLTVIGFTIGGQYVTPGGFGGYLSLPLSYLAVDVPFELPPFFTSDSQLAFGNFELGGLYSTSFSDHAAIVVHAGVALPTAGDDDLAASQIVASSPRYGDLVQRIPDSTWLRIGASPMGRAGKLFWRADVGLDLALDEDRTDYSPIFRINVGGGLDLGSAHLLVELVNNVVDDDTPANDEVSSTLAFGARFLAGNLRPGIGLIVPIDFDGPIFDPEFAITASLAARL
jgi:hypothetical protein